MKIYMPSTPLLAISLCGIFATSTDAARIKVTVQSRERGVNTGLAGAEVDCYDEDSFNFDDFLGGNETSIIPSISHTVSIDYDESKDWDFPFFTEPDIYCRIRKEDYITLYTGTKEDVDAGPDDVVDFGTVTVYPDRSGFPGNTNGCGAESDWPVAAEDLSRFLPDLSKACDNRNLCYNNCQETKQDCDDEFRGLLTSRCEDINDLSTSKASCLEVAEDMYDYVLANGQAQYSASQAEFCCGDGIDSDNDGLDDCTDGCPNDGNKYSPGECGCGTPEGECRTCPLRFFSFTCK